MTPARTTGHALVIDGIGVARDHYLQLAAQALSTGHDPITRHSPARRLTPTTRRTSAVPRRHRTAVPAHHEQAADRSRRPPTIGRLRAPIRVAGLIGFEATTGLP
jgi:hypothetical protein